MPPPPTSIGSSSDMGIVHDDEAKTPPATSLPFLLDPNNNKYSVEQTCEN
jgi:hypothetical protein